MVGFKSIMLLKWIFMIYLQPCLNNDSDYWSESFYSDQNCKSPEIISKLKDTQCQTVTITKGEVDSFRQCKIRLSAVLQKVCDYTKVENPGYLKYCERRGTITCCFKDHACVADWSVMHQNIYKMAKTYLKDKIGFLKSLVESVGYKTCHPLNSLDASICANDCKKLGKQKFATNCSSNGGLFKCCIRRDKRGCHECRFCCTLPMCSYPEGGKDNTEFDGLTDLKLENQNNTIQANDIFFSQELMYKAEDYRCLKPDSHKYPEKWDIYEMEAFRRAFSTDTLERAQSFKYDNNMLNFVDPKVFKHFTKNEKRSKMYWKRTYGFEYVHNVANMNQVKSTTITWIQHFMPCTRKCIRLKNSKFARRCKKRGGLFKCCISHKYLNPFEETRVQLIKEGLVKKPYDPVCKPLSTVDPCMFCTLNSMCTIKNPITGELEQSFKWKMKDRHKVGGPAGNIYGLRICWCTGNNFCKNDTSYYNDNQFQLASTRQEFCAVENIYNNQTTEREKCIFQCADTKKDIWLKPLNNQKMVKYTKKKKKSKVKKSKKLQKKKKRVKKSKNKRGKKRMKKSKRAQGKKKTIGAYKRGKKRGMNGQRVKKLKKAKGEKKKKNSVR